ELGPESLKVLVMDLWLCSPQEWCWLVSTVSWLHVVEQQLNLSSMATRLRVTCEAHPYPFQLVRGRRSLVKLGIRSTGSNDKDHHSWYQSKLEIVCFHEIIAMAEEYSSSHFSSQQQSEVVGLCGPRDWAQSTHRFSVCERDRAGHRVLENVVEGLRLHARRVARVGRPADVSNEKATASPIAFRPRFRVLSVKTTDRGIAFRTRQPDLSRSSSECAVPRRHVLKATKAHIAFNASTLVEIENHGVHVVCVCVASSVTPTVVTSLVGYPRF
ncbi:hypothetical protein Taro_029638, partial [Colocasia esculenta]|nr:hypothetical protein [Colocasia esculenta]